MTQAAVLAAYPASAQNFRNKIINGGFDIWQRGTSISLSNAALYTADRWQVGGSTASVGRVEFTNGQTDVPNNPKYFARWTISANSQNYEFVQKIEGVQTLAGQVATWSFFIRQTSGSVALGARLVQDFGTGGSPSALNVVSLGAVTIGANWRRVVITTTVPSITGKTIGSNANDSVWLSLQISNTATGVIEIADVQFEAGSAATPFERRPAGLELLLCQRYYAQTGNTEYHFNPAPGATYVTTYRANMPVRMRVNPSVVLNYSQSNAIQAYGLYTTNQDFFVHYISASVSTNAYMYFTWTANAEL